MNDLIDQLKANEKSFGLMSPEMQAKAKAIGTKDFQTFLGCTEGRWQDASGSWYFSRTYRLRSDYEEKPEIVECEIYEKNSVIPGAYIKVYNFGNIKGLGLGQYPNGYERVGFKFEDGTVRPSPVMPFLALGLGRWPYVSEFQSGEAKTFHATHVLFRRPK